MAIDVLRLPAPARAHRLRVVASSTVVPLVLVAGATAVAAVLRLHALGAQSFWQDEGLSVWIAQKNVPAILTWLHAHSVHPPLYFLLLHLWMKHSTSVAWIRLLSVIPSVLTVPFAYALAKRLFGSDRVGVLTALLVAISPFNVYYGQEARMYSLLSLGTVAASYFLVAALQTDRRSWWGAYVAAAVVVVYTQNVGIFVLAAHGVILVTLALWRRREAVHGLVALAVVVVMWTPWLPAVAGQTGKGGATWVTNPSPADLRDLMDTFTSYVLPLHVQAPVVGGLRLASNTRGFVPPVTAAVVVALLVVAVLGVAALPRRRLFVAGVLVVGPLVFEIDQGIVAPVFIDRTLIFVSVAYLIAVAGGLVALTTKPRTRPVGVALLAALLLLNVLSLRQYYNVADGQTIKEPWNRAAAFVARIGRPGDVLLMQSNTAELPFDYYYDRLSPRRGRLPELGVPCPINVCSRFEAQATPQDRRNLTASIGHYRRLVVVKRWYGNWHFVVQQALARPRAFRLRWMREVAFNKGAVVTIYDIAPRRGTRR